jgi:hypothetical protein
MSIAAQLPQQNDAVVAPIQLEAALHEFVEQGDRAMREGRFAQAAECYLRALSPNAPDPTVRRGFIVASLKAGHIEAAQRFWLSEQFTGRTAELWIRAEIEKAMTNSDFTLLGPLGRMLAQYRWRSPWFPVQLKQEASLPRVPRDTLTVSKLRHDAGQFAYLRQLGLMNAEFDSTIAIYERLAERLSERGGTEARRPMNKEERALIGNVYNRIVHVPEVGRVARALSTTWKPREVEARFLDNNDGIVVIDDFLTPEALQGLHRFVMQSTVWSGIRYRYGRFGAFFNDGFNCPLLLQVAEELRQAFPRVITRSYPLRQIWGFKNSTDMPPDANLHADFAAVNVNFWLTPDECNLHPETGGMMVYDVDAPQTWDFHTYNGRTDIIKAFLRENRARETYIPYRQNRCIIFNSDLFHGTHAVHFKRGFVNHRVNVTMLYGHRENDELHRSMTSRPDLETRWKMQHSAWRSFAFSRHRQ